MSEPPITRMAAHMSGSQGRPTRIVHHDEEYPELPTAAEDIAGYFANPNCGGSAHYVTDDNSEQHCVPDGVVAWHAPPNGQGDPFNYSIGIEQSGYARQCRAEWLDPYSRANLARTCARTAELCVRFQLPIVYLSTTDLLNGHHGITSHNNVSAAWHQSDHCDPGAAYPWDIVIPVVRAGAAMIVSPTAVKDFQAAHRLVVDGDCGILTTLALGTALRPVLDRVVDAGGGTSGAPSAGNRFANMPEIAYGSTGSAVQALQDALNKISGARLGVDGQFGPATDYAVRNFQRFFRITVDGVVGPQTWALLDYLLDLKHL